MSCKISKTILLVFTPLGVLVVCERAYTCLWLLACVTITGYGQHISGESTFYRYIGCYQDAHSPSDPPAMSKHLYTDTAGLTNDQCAGSCRMKGFRYAGTKTHDCYCGEKYDRYGLSNQDDFCGTQCPGNTSQICGSMRRLSIFDTANDQHCLVPERAQIPCGPGDRASCDERSCCYNRLKKECFHSNNPCLAEKRVCNYGATCTSLQMGRFSCKCPWVVPSMLSTFSCSAKPGNRCNPSGRMILCGNDGINNCVLRGCCFEHAKELCYHSDAPPVSECSGCNLTMEFESLKTGADVGVV